jgi:hypothetical protein
MVNRPQEDATINLLLKRSAHKTINNQFANIPDVYVGMDCSKSRGGGQMHTPHVCLPFAFKSTQPHASIDEYPSFISCKTK